MMRLLRGDLGMDGLVQLERKIQGWLKGVPHLPRDARRWLGANMWWLVGALAVITGIAVFSLILATFSSLAMLGNPYVGFYASTTLAALATVKTMVSLIFTAVVCFLLALAVAPLKEKQKKGWYLIFAATLVCVASVVVGAAITLNAFAFLTNIIFGAVWLLLVVYIVFEVHGEFVHVERSKGVKKNA